MSEQVSVFYGPFEIKVSHATAASCKLEPGQQVDKKQMQNAIYIDRINSAALCKREVLEAAG